MADPGRATIDRTAVELTADPPPPVVHMVMANAIRLVSVLALLAGGALVLAPMLDQLQTAAAAAHHTSRTAR